MEYSININTENNCAAIIVSGYINVQGVAETLNSLLSNNAWHPDMDLLADYSKSSTVELDTEKVSQISELVKSQKEKFGTGKMAIIMSSELDFGYARMFQLLTEDYIAKEVNVFRDSEHALNWLFDSKAVKS